MSVVLQMPSKDPAVAARQKRDEIVTAHLSLVPKIARRMKRTHWRLDLDDLKGAGYIGLIQAAERYTRAHHCAFQTFAYSRIQGEMLELARRRQLQENCCQPLPVMEPRDRQAARSLEAVEVRECVQAILTRLSPEAREVLIAHYLQGKSLKVVGRERGIARTTASDRLQDALRRARRAESRAA